MDSKDPREPSPLTEPEPEPRQKEPGPTNPDLPDPPEMSIPPRAATIRNMRGRVIE